jgi:hypothetical protein
MPDRPLLPTVDPKDIIPLDLYHADRVSSQALRRIPADLLDHLEAAKDREMTALKSELFPNQTVSLAALSQKTQRLLSEIESIESNHKEALNNIIKEMVEDNYGSDVKQQLKIQITKEFPARQESSEGDQLKDSPMLTAQVFRREVYNYNGPRNLDSLISKIRCNSNAILTEVSNHGTAEEAHPIIQGQSGA